MSDTEERTGRSPLMDLVELSILKLVAPRDIIKTLILDHDMSRDDARELYIKTVDMITEDEYMLTEEQERAIRMASLRRDHADAEASGDLREKVKIKREFAETRDILSPKRVEVHVEGLDKRTHGEVIADILASLDLDDDEDAYDQHDQHEPQDIYENATIDRDE